MTAAPSIRDHFRPFFTGLGLRPVLLLPVGFLLAIVWGQVGWGFGIPDQIFHEDPNKQLLAGLGAALLLLQVCVVAYLLDGEKPWLAGHGGPADASGNTDRRMGWYLDRSWLPLLVLAGGSVALKPPERWPFLVGLLVPPAVYLLGRLVLGARGPGPARRIGPGPTPRPRPVVEAVLHGLVALVGVALVGVVIPNRELHQLCFTLACWAALHGALLFFFRYRRIPEPDRRRAHLRAGLAFGLFFLVYMAMFLVYWFDPPGELAARIAPPALVCFLLLCLVVTVHGFLEYHLRGWYVLAVLLLLAVIGLLNGRPRFKLHFPGLDYERPVQMLDADAEGRYSQLLRRLAELREEPTDPARRDAVVSSYYQLTVTLGNLQLRLRQRLADMGRVPGKGDDPGWLPNSQGIIGLLSGQRFAEAESAFRRCKAMTDRLSGRLGQLEIDALEAWKKQATPPGGGKPKLVVVATSGGASRSALWTAYALDQVEQELGKRGVVLPRHVRLVSGASGGMLGAAYWVATIDEARREHAVGDHDEFVSRVARDGLTPLGHHALFLDLPTLLLPGEFNSDRGIALERAWSKHLDGALDRGVRSLAKGEVEGWRPSLVFAPMLVEDGRRLLISNQSLPFLTESAGRTLEGAEGEEAEAPSPKQQRRPRPMGKATSQDAEQAPDERRKPRRDRYSLSAVEFFQLFPLADRFRLSTAVRMSATFPYFSPAVDLPTEPRRRVVDAGYYDNYGVDVAAQWLYHYRGWIARNTSGVVLIQLRDATSEQRRLFPDDQPPFWGLARSVEWATGPLVGAGSAREAAMSFRNDELVERLDDQFNRDGKPMFTTVVFEAQEQIALSWYLSSEQVARMKTGFDQEGGAAPPNRRALDRLLAWWQRDHSSR